MLNYLKNNKMSVVVLIGQISLAVLHKDNANAALAWLISALWMASFLYLEHESKSVIDAYKKYIDSLEEEIEQLNSRIPAISPEVNK